jgi:hypothetical protein
MSNSVLQRLYTEAGAIINKSIRLMGGKSPTSTVVPFKVDPDGVLSVSQDTVSTGSDSAGKLRVSEPRSLFDIKHIYDKSPDTTVEEITGGATATHVPAEAAVDLTVNNTGDKVWRRSKIWVPYEPGRSQNWVGTGVFGTGVTGIEKRIGYFDQSDGIFFLQDGPASTDYKLVLRSSTAYGTKTVARSAWDDPLDGTGPSGDTVPLDEGLIFSVDFLWLGMDRVRVGVKYQGVSYTIHTFAHVGLTGPYWRRGSLPISYEIENVSAGAVSSTLRMVCSAVFSEGGYDPVGRSGTVPNTNNGNISGLGTSVLLTSIRLKSAYEKALLIPVGFNAVSADNKINLLELVVGGTITDPGANMSGWTSVTQGVEYNNWGGVSTGGYPTVTGGKAIFSVMSSAGATGQSLGLSVRDLPGQLATGPELLSLVVTRLQSGNSDYNASLNFEEVY